MEKKSHGSDGLDVLVDGPPMLTRAGGVTVTITQLDETVSTPKPGDASSFDLYGIASPMALFTRAVLGGADADIRAREAGFL